MEEFPTSAEFDHDDKALMQQFVGALWDLLIQLVERGTDDRDRLVFEEGLRILMLPALLDTKPEFDRLGGAIAEISPESIERHGLYGDPLRFKLAVVRHWYDAFRGVGGVGLLRRLLDALEGLLDSIIDAAGTGGAVKEIKEAIRNSTKNE